MESLKDSKDTAPKKSINPQTMVRTDFKEQKLEKFFSTHDTSVVKENKKPKMLDVSHEEEYEKEHELFLKEVNNLEDKIAEKSMFNTIMEVESGW